jgi:DNA-binding CsgD family transcriptional regulator/PAS domain-containing protein
MAYNPLLDERDLLDLVRQIYAAAENIEQWPSLLGRLSNLLNATAGSLDLYDTTKKEAQLAASVNIDPAFSLKYTTQFASKNLWVNYRSDIIRTGRTLTGQMILPDQVLFRSEFYQDLLRTENIFHLIGARILEKEGMAAHLSLFRPRNRDPFEKAEIEVLDFLMPHLQQAVRLAQRIANLETTSSVLKNVLHQMPVGVILLDGTGRVVVMNTVAEEIVAQRDGLTASQGSLRAASKREHDALSALIHQSAAISLGKGLHPGGILRVARPTLKRPLVVQVIPFHSHSLAFGKSTVAVIVFVSDPDALPPPSSHLGCAYGLTPAEATLATHLAQGKSVESASEEMRITLNTARTHLKHIFAKTGAQRQSDLVRLLLTGVTGLHSL